MEDLFFTEDLIFLNVNLFESFIVSRPISIVRDNIPPFFVICIDKVLDLEFDSRLKIRVLSVFKELVAYLFNVI